MFILWTWTWNKKGKMPSIWEDLYKLLKKKNFSSSMQIQKEKMLKELKKKKNNMQVFSVQNKNKNVEKTEQKKKTLY